MKMVYIDYFMLVIVFWVLLDVCDGLKLVYCWVLYGMLELGLIFGKVFKKLVCIVGEVFGKYYLYGDFFVYDIMVWMV